MPFKALTSDERVEIQLPDCVLSGWLRRAKSSSFDAPTHPLSPQRPGLVILVHGRLHRHDVGPCSDIAESGLLPYDVFTFDLRGYGQSTGETGYDNARQEAEDLHLVVKHLVQRGETIVAIIGHSKGAVCLLMYAALHPTPCRLLVSLSARYSTRGHDFESRFTEEQRRDLDVNGQMVWLHYRRGENLEHRAPYIVTKDAIERYKSSTLEPYLRTISPSCHVLVIHGRSDGTVEPWNSERIVSDLKDANVAADMIQLDGAAHNFEDDGETSLLATLIGVWIARRAEMRPVDGSKAIVDHLNLAAVQSASSKSNTDRHGSMMCMSDGPHQ